MGRKKLKISRLESNKARQIKYSKRKVGVLKKAKELSTLCDIDLAIIMFSPTEKPTLYVAHDKQLVTVLERLSSLSVEEREHRRAYTMRKVNKMANPEVAKKNSSLNKDEAVKPGQALQLQKNHLGELKQKLIEKSRILRDWKNPYTVDNLDQIKVMEEHLIASLERIKERKIQLWEQQKGHKASKAKRTN
ncbi:hypothetical protein JCGZ_07594 [Jatropha curcas]|uniref:MADS-box domain-containing protein n=1 Tax=Jatropha curcas TaxID=180498 RepID=A0A067KG77_JATCU|nr:agamous-like MADS-box protein AGL65 [Jatropha curcas]KDP34023.1 hypothetical protein JCGZ_07594 [Jatropha curcas]